VTSGLGPRKRAAALPAKESAAALGPTAPLEEVDP
jgi:hypothetical protein